MWRKFRFAVSVKINRALGKVSDKKAISIQEEEILMGQ